MNKKKLIIAIIFTIISLSMGYSQAAYKSYYPCTFKIKIPDNFKLDNMDPNETNLDYCDFELKLPEGKVIATIGSLNKTRFEYSDVEEFYKAALASKSIHITYQFQKKNWFVISGTDLKTNDVVYWKRVIGKNFVSDLYFQYPPEEVKLLDPFIAPISKSFDSD